MQSQKSNEESEELANEIKKDYRKANQFPKSVIGRKRLRGLRRALFEIGIPFPIPMNSAYITDEYCKVFGKEESDDWRYDVLLGAKRSRDQRTRSRDNV